MIDAIRHRPQIEILEDVRVAAEERVVRREGLALPLVHRGGVDAEETQGPVSLEDADALLDGLRSTPRPEKLWR